MTSSPWGGVTTADERDALHGISQMLVGTKMLRDEPGVVYSLAAQQARPQDAQAVDQFMQSLDAEKQVNLARATGERIHLDDNQRLMLRQNGVAFNDVMYTQVDAATDAAKYVQDASGGKETVKVDPKTGKLALDGFGQIQVISTQQDTNNDSGWFDSIGSFFGHVGGAVKTGVGDALHKVVQGFNFVQSALTAGSHSGFDNFYNPGNPLTARLNAEATMRQDMEASGYDSNSWTSTLAFYASGKAHSDLSSLNQTYGMGKVNEALTYLSDPEKFRKAIEEDPNSYTTTADGQTALTPDATARLKRLASPEFQDLARQVNAHTATVGNDLANSLGIDPIDHPTWYGVTAAGTNIAASFAIDPTLLLLKGVQAAKFSAVGIDTLGDADKAASILTRSSKLPWVNNVQRGWQAGIDYGKAMRATTDTVEQAALTAKFSAAVPSLAPLASEFIGTHALLDTEEAIVNGRRIVRPIYGETGGINSLDEAAQWVKSKQGLNLLYQGRAATQASLMPGAVSAFGYRKLKGLTAGWMSSRSAVRAEDAAATVVSRAEADPMLAKKLIDAGTLTRLDPAVDDAVVMVDGHVLAAPGAADVGTDGLASANRGQLAITPAGRGDVAYNLRKTGDALGEGKLGYFSLAAINARARLAVQRFSTLLPRNSKLSVTDPLGGDKVFKFALTYLNRGDANTLRALWNGGDGGVRKAIVHGLMDQVGHAAGLGRTTAGQKILDAAKAADERYSAAGGEIELGSDRLALFEGQTRDEWTLRSFRALQQASSKIGLWEATMSRAMTKGQVDGAMAAWKMGALFKPSTASRNMLEGWLHIILNGHAGDAIKARALLTARNKELWDRGYGTDHLDAYRAARGAAESTDRLLKDGGLTAVQRTAAYAKSAEAKRVMATLESKPIVKHLLATEGGDSFLAKQIEQASMLSGQRLGRGVTSTKLANLAPLALVGRAYRDVVGKFMDEGDIKAFMTLGADELDSAIEGYAQQALAFDLGLRHAATELTDHAEQGYGPARVRVAVHNLVSQRHVYAAGKKPAFSPQPLDGTLGVDRYANALHQRVDAMPETARAALDYIDNPSVGIDHVVQAMEGEKKLSGFGSVFFEDNVNFPNAARRAVNDDERAVGKRDWAQKVVAEYKYMLTGRNGVFQKDLAKEIRERGVAPDAGWIGDHITLDNRPASMIAQESMPMVNGGLKSVPQTLQDVAGGAYQHLVERTLQRTTTSPIFMVNYTIARKGLNKQVEQLIQQGFSREAADNMAKELSIRQAWVKSENMIDDPGQKTQFDVIARNMFPFSRASQAMVRRWSTGLWQNPVAARKMMLAYEGAVHSGFIYNNSYGEPTFTYPASGALAEVMGTVMQLPPFGSNGPMFPVAGSMTGGVLMSVPGADNPLRISMGPMLAVPIRWAYKNILPTSYRGTAEELDRLVNGPIGTGQTWSTLVPTVVRKFYQAFSTDDRNSALTSAVNGAIANLAAAGLAPSPDASPSEFQQFRARLQTQVQNQLFTRAIFGLFAPAAPSTPTESTSTSGSDFAFDPAGMLQMSDEYRQILNEVGGDLGRANAVFTALHPDSVNYKTGETKLASSAYETGRTSSTTPGVYLPSTQKALDWMTMHGDFIGKYKSVAAYFLPPSSTGEPFSDAAYQAQLELGLRIRKTPQEFMDDIYVKHAEAQYYPAVHQLDDQIAQAKQAGDDAQASALTQAKSNWESEYKALNPLFGQKQEQYGPARATALGQLADIRRMLHDGDVPDGQAPQLAQLVTAYDNYEAFIRAHPGSDNANTAMRSSALAATNAWAEQTLKGTPVAAIFDGVFRVLNTNFSDLGA